MPMMYNPAGSAQRAGGNSSPSNNRQTNLQRLDDAARRRRQERAPAQGRSPALPGVPQLRVAGLPNPQQQQQQQQPQQSQQPYNPSAMSGGDYSQVPEGAQTLMPAGGQQQQSPAQQSAQQQQQGQMQLPSEVGGAMGQMIPRGGGGFPGGAQTPQGGQTPMLPQQEGTPSGPGMQTPMGGGTGGSGFPGQEIDPSMGSGTAQTGGGGTGAQDPSEFQMPTNQPLPEGAGEPKLPGEGPQLSSEVAGGGEATGTDPYAEERSQYEDLIAQAKADEEAALQGIDADIARAQRRQAEMNAAMGGAVGGGLMGGMATTATLGAREKAEATASAREKTRNLQLSWLDRQLELKERDINRKFGREMSARDKAHQIELEAVRMRVDLPPEYHSLMADGKYDEANELYDSWSGGGGGGGGGGQGGEGSAPMMAGYKDGWVVGNPNTGDRQYKYGNHDHAISTVKMMGVIERMMNTVGLDEEWVGESNFMSGSPGDYRFGGNVNKVEEIHQFFSRYLHENDGAYPGPSALEDFLIEKGYINYDE